MFDETKKIPNLVEEFKTANQKLIELIGQTDISDEVALKEVNAWFDAHVALAQNQPDDYQDIFMPLYISVLETIKDKNPKFIKHLDTKFDEQDEYAILGNMDIEDGEKADKWDEATTKLRSEIQANL